MNNTALDITGNDMHVGSFAVRQFIEKYQPHLTLHGHIHETVVAWLRPNFNFSFFPTQDSERLPTVLQTFC